MSSTLDACFKSAEKVAIVSVAFLNTVLISYLHIQNDLETRKKELAAEEAEMSEQQQRLDAQRAIELYDELGSELASAFFLVQTSMLI